jgi:uncharacterized protein
MVKHNTQMRWISLVTLLFFFNAAFSQRAIPELWGHRIHDEAHVLQQQTIDSLEHMLTRHEDSTGNQIAVLVIPSLDGDNLEEYALRVANDAWKLGTRNNDNGVLLLVVINDRKMRIEVGEGLEGPLPDAIANRIIRNEMAPFFREQNYDAGVMSGVHAIVKAVQNEYTVSADEGLEDLSWKARLLIGAFVFLILGIFTLVALFLPGCVGWGLYAFLIPFYATFPMVVLGVTGGLTLLGVYVVGFPILKLIMGRTPLGKRMATSMASTNSGGGWTSRSGGFGGFSGGGGSRSSSRGFSGGGGSFGGGGSSGRW